MKKIKSIKKILVTGSEGSLMQWVIPHLLEQGYEVRGVDNLFRYRKVKRGCSYEFIKGDLTNQDFVRKICKNIDGVIQAAAQIYGVHGFHKYPADILAKDVVLHQNILWEAVRNRIKKVVYISSSMVYERAKEVPVREEDTEYMMIPHTDYGLSKLVGERLSQAFRQQYGLDYTIWRPFNIITPYEKAEKEQGISHVFADFLQRIIIDKQNPVEILGDGNQIRCFTWIGDVAQAIAQYSFIKKTSGEIFNLGNPEPITMKELAQKIFKKAQTKGIISKKSKLTFKHLPIYEDDVRVRVPVVEKVYKILNWRAAVNLDEALDRCIDYLIKTKLK